MAVSTATRGLPADRVGAASALVSVMQQLGGSIGTALLSSIAATATASYIAARHIQGAAADTHGYDVAFLAAAGMFAAAAVTCWILIRTRNSPDHPRT